MTEGFEVYDHVPQQSRRDKLRMIMATQENPNLHECSSGLFTFYDPSLISTDLLTYASSDHVKDENVNFMSFPANINMNPSSSSSLNPSSVHDMNNNPFIYPPQNVENPKEPLSLSLSSRSLEPNIQRYGSSSSYDSVSLGPFMGYASILKGSRFLKPAQQILVELCDVWDQRNCKEKIVVDSVLMYPSFINRSGLVDSLISCEDGVEGGRTKSRLISMLDEVSRRYRQYFQQMQAVMASFECVAGRNAAPYINLAIKSMYQHFSYLKNAITDQLQFNNKCHRGNSSQNSVYSSAFLEHQPVCLPQRGLPERAVNVLRAWLFEHFLHPYPTDADKLMLAKQTGLSRSQVSNWFINARVRIWKPMVEEMHMLEAKQSQKALQWDEQNAQSTSTCRRVQNPSEKCDSSNELKDIAVGNPQMLNTSYNNSCIGVNMAGGNGGVSLTLGLQHNNDIGLSEPFPINAAQRFGVGLVEANNSEGYVMSRHFGIGHMIGGQLLHDFVG